MIIAKKFDVYGVGNALVDIEFEVDLAFLGEAKIEKGLMTLVDENRQTEIYKNLHGIEHKKTCGGSAANTMIAISQFGGKSFYSCKVANDELGKFYFEDLVSHGVATNLSLNSLENGVTGKCFVMITPDADRTMNTFLGITQNLSTKELEEKNIKESNYVYLEGYLVASPSGKEACIRAKEIAEKNGVKTALTFSDVNMINFFADVMKEIIGNGVDLLFCNEAEAYAYTKVNSLMEAANELKKIAKTFAITLSAKGALVFDGENFIQIETPQVKPVDTNGAGDLFAGAMLYGINNGLSYQKAASVACYASSILVTQFGARLRTEQVIKLKQQIL